jgi:AcrR family transcriptional regulator
MTVNHDERRHQIAEVTAAVIAREGLEAATIRRISAEFGGPTKIVTYYFADKHELLHSTWEYAALQYIEKITTNESRNLIDTLLAMAASDERSIVRWRVYVAFWDLAARDPAFAESQRRHLELALTRIGDMVRTLVPGRKDIDRVSLFLNALVQGISLQALVAPERWPADRIRAVLTDQVQLLLSDRTVPA